VRVAGCLSVGRVPGFYGPFLDQETNVATLASPRSNSRQFVTRHFILGMWWRFG